MILGGLFLVIAAFVGVYAFGLPKLQADKLATNEDIRISYGINVVDNPSFQDETFIKMGDDHLVHLCDRPTVQELRNSEALSCKVA
jgi:hypothetical protein